MTCVALSCMTTNAGRSLILRAESVAHPRAERWTAREDRAGIHLANARRVIDAIRPARADHRQIIRACRDCAAANRSPKGRSARAASRCVCSPRSGELNSPIAVMTCPKLSGIGCPASSFSAGLGSNVSMMARPAFHEQKDDALRPRREMRRTRCEGPRERARLFSARIALEQIRQRQSAKRGAGTREEIAAGSGEVVVRKDHFTSEPFGGGQRGSWGAATSWMLVLERCSAIQFLGGSGFASGRSPINPRTRTRSSSAARGRSRSVPPASRRSSAGRWCGAGCRGRTTTNR